MAKLTQSFTVEAVWEGDGESTNVAHLKAAGDATLLLIEAGWKVKTSLQNEDEGEAS